MQEHDLLGLWSQGDAEAKSHYERVAPHIEEWAKLRSRDLFVKLRRLVLLELLGIACITIVFFTWIDSSSPSFWPMVIIFTVVAVLSLAWYIHVNHKLSVLQALPTLDSVSGRASILKKFIRRMRIVLFAGTPLAYFLGSYLQWLEDQDASNIELIVTSLISLPIMGFLIWFMDRIYIKKVYLPVLFGYEEVLRRLTENE